MSALGQDRSFDLGPPNVRFESEADIPSSGQGASTITALSDPDQDNL
jgi:hypothetical protein